MNEGGPIQRLDGRTLSPATVVGVARARNRVALTDDARTRLEAAWRAGRELVSRGTAVYGRTTGVGALKEYQVAETGAAEHDLRMLRSHACGVGEPVAPEVARAMLAVRANQLAAGGSGVSPGFVDGVVAALNNGHSPAVRTVGGLGTGDLTSLAEAGLALVGEGSWLDEPAVPVALQPGDALAWLSSNARTVGEAALACYDAASLLASADAVAALSFEAVVGDDGAYDERVQLARPHHGQQAAAAHLRALLGTDRPPGARLQDPLSFRCVPQVHGAARDALAEIERVLAVELNAAGDNPLLVAGDTVALHNGNFHAVRLGLVLDQLRAAMVHVAALSAQRLSSLCDPAMTGLPAFLVSGPDASSGVLILEYTAHAALGELRATAAPASLPGPVIARAVEDHASFTALSARQSRQALSHCATVLGAELVVAVRALRMADRQPAGLGTKTCFDRAAAVLPADLVDRPLGDDVEAAAALLWGAGLEPDARSAS